MMLIHITTVTWKAIGEAAVTIWQHTMSGSVHYSEQLVATCVVPAFAFK